MESLIQDLRPIFFIAFFIGTALTYYFQDQFHLRQIHITVFFTCLILVSVVGAQFLPIVTLHKFVLEGPEERTEYEIRIVDAEENELLVDSRALEPIPASRVTVLGERMVNEYDRADREAAAKHILDETQVYRDSLETGSLTHSNCLEFPRHGFGLQWDANTLSEYDAFVAVRVYEVDTAYSKDGTDIVSQSESLVYEYSKSETETELVVTRSGS